MRVVTAALVSVALTAAPLSSADAHGFYHHHHGFGPVGFVFGLAGAVVVGAATIATLPIRVLADAASGPHYRDRPDYDRRDAYDRSYDEDGPRYGYGREGYYSRGRYRGGPDDGYAPRDYRWGDERDGPAYGERSYEERGDDAYAGARDRYEARGYDRDRAYDDGE